MSNPTLPENRMSASKISQTRETRISSNGNSNSPNQLINSRRLSTLRDATQRSVAVYRTELGSTSDHFLASCTSLEVFFDAVAGIRLRQMPHPSSRWDKVLKWAEFFAAQVQGYLEEVSQFADYADEAARIIWASSLALIQVYMMTSSTMMKRC